MNEWPALYNMLSGNPFGRYRETLQNVVNCLKKRGRNERRLRREHAIQPLASDPALQGELPQQ